MCLYLPGNVSADSPALLLTQTAIMVSRLPVLTRTWGTGGIPGEGLGFLSVFKDAQLTSFILMGSGQGWKEFFNLAKSFN